MKKVIFLTFVLLLTIVSQAQTKSKKEVVFTTKPEIECERCVQRIKDALKFEKGVNNVIPDLKTKLITVQYDNEKTNVQNLITALEKIGYKASVVDTNAKQKGETEKTTSNKEGIKN